MAEEISVVMGIVDQITKESKTIAENLKRETLAIQKAEAERSKAAARDAAMLAKERERASREAVRTENQARQESLRQERAKAREVARILAEEERTRKQAAVQEEARMRQRLQLQRNSIALAERQAKEAEANRPKGFIESVRGGFVSGSGMGGGVAGFAAMGAAAAGAAVGVHALTSAVQASIDTANRLNSAGRALQFAMGDMRGARQEMEYIREESRRLGLEFVGNVQQYARISAAAKGTRLEGQGVRDIYKGISEAAITLNLSQAETAGALNAIGQMISKGTVQAEELRGQLGERLPGAFQIAARAMGVTTQQLGKMLEQGQVISDEFLPKFAAELQKTYGDSAVKAAGEARAEIQRMHNEIATGSGSIGEAAVRTYGLIARAFNAMSDTAREAAKSQNQLNLVMAGTAGQGGVNQLLQLEKERAATSERYSKAAQAQANAEQFRMVETAKAIEATNKKIAEDQKASNETLADLAKELATAKALAGKEGYERERAQANLDLERNLEAAKGFQETELAARNLHKQRMIDIARAEGQEAEEARQEAAYQAGEAARARQRREAEGRLRNQQANAKADDDEAKARAEKMQAATRRFEDVNASGDPLAQLRLQQARELALYAEGSEARKTIQRAHLKEMADAQAKHTKDMGDAWLDLASTMSGALQSVAGDNGFTRIINRTLEVVGVLMALQRQMQAIQAMSGVTAGAGAIGLSAAMPWVGAGIAALSLGSMLFREDGGPVYGRRHSQGGVPMVAEEGELVWSRKNVARVGGMANAEAMRQGGGMGGVYAPQVTVGGMQITVQGDMTPQATARVEQLGNDYIRKVEKAVEQLVLNRSPGMMRAFGNMRLA